MSEQLRVAQIRTALRGSAFAHVSYMRETASTNDDAMIFLDDTRPAGRLFLADYQRGGRGRRGRAWNAPFGSAILMTLVLPRSVAPAALWVVPFWTALQTADAIEQVCGVRVDVKWPNDLMLGDGKCAGVLCISRTRGTRAAVACGIGIDVRAPEDDAPTDPEARYLSAFAADVRREPLVIALAELCEARLHALTDPAGIVAAWERRAELAGTRYALALDDEARPLVGTAVGLAPGGGLRLRDDDGEERTIDAAVATVTGRGA